MKSFLKILGCALAMLVIICLLSFVLVHYVFDEDIEKLSRIYNDSLYMDSLQQASEEAEGSAMYVDFHKD